jgi:diguanylate cyclase (GGDEF)-like protein/PAS domain S-box-containing protein
MNDTKNRRILVVDDNAAIHEDFRKILGRKNRNAEIDQLERELFGLEPAPIHAYDIDSAFQGQEALAKVEAALAKGEHYALAFVDMRMPPGWDGVQTIQKIWEVDPEIQIVISTAYSDYSWEQILARFGESDRLLVLKKPFDTGEVCQLACALTEKWHLARHAHLKLSQLTSMVGEQTEALRASEARYALAAAGANDGLWDWDLANETIYYSARWKGILGLGEHEVDDQPNAWFGRVHADDLEPLHAAMRDHLTGVAKHFQCEYRIRHKDGQYRWMLCRGLAVRDPAGNAARIAGSQTDITDRKLAEEQLRHDALHDALTGLANRALLTDRLKQCLLRARRQPDQHFAVLFLDLDRFKLINDSLGHLVGDQLLIGISKRLLGCLRNTDSIAQLEANNVARLGGDEFVVLLEGLRHPEDALRVAARLQDSLRQPFVIEGREVYSSMSLGIALGRADYDKPEDVLRDADTALYQAKANGRGCYEVYDSTMHASAMSRWWIENELRSAIARDELRLVYQPVISLATGEITEFEALLRWQHGTRGAISPADFIPIAEDSGLIGSLGHWVMRQAIEQMSRWQAELPVPHDFSVAINVSGRQLTQPDLLDSVAEALREKGVAPERVRLEVTESALMKESVSSRISARLAELNLRLHLDDFGTGYSSLSYLHRMPVDALKIDRSFVSEMTKDSTSASIVQSIITLAHTLGAVVIAEGVETAEQLEHLRRLGCDMAQGYYFSRPLEVPQATDYLAPPLRRAAGGAR